VSIYERLDNELAAKDDRISELERENAAQAQALQIERECVASLTRDNGVLLQAADATKAGSLAVSQAGQIEHLERENAALRKDKEQMRDALQTALGSLCSAAIREGVAKHIEAVLSNTEEEQP